MSYISTSPLYLPFLCKATGYVSGQQAVCIVNHDENGSPIAGVIYDGYNGGTVHAHIWVDAERRPMKEWYAAIFDYPFNQLQVYKIVGQVRQSNEEARRLDEHFGFILEAEIKGYYPEGDSLMVYTMTHDQCRILNSPIWAKIAQKVRGIH